MCGIHLPSKKRTRQAIQSRDVEKNMNLVIPTTLLCLFLGIHPVRAADDIVLADFESPTYAPWQSFGGEAFGPGPAQGTLPGQMLVDGFKGHGLVNSFYKGDGSTGMLVSPKFKIERKYISFLIGGGMNPETTVMKLLVDGKTVRRVTGLNDKPGGAETLGPEYWNVADLAGQSGVIQITDTASGSWGHITVDHIVQTDKKPVGMRINPDRQFSIARKYLNIPIKTGAPKRVVKLLVDGKLQVRNDMELASGKPDWWAPMDVSAWNGKTVMLQVDRLPDDSQALEQMDQTDTIKESGDLYREPLRGQFHFSPKRGWNNDPNGMVYYNGEYHLFFQHNPYGWGWGNMHWGHAVSRDMIHWEELGDKLMPDDMGPIFSGSAVVDWHNASGFGKPGKPPLVLIYTAAGNPAVQCLAYSTDGRTFTKYRYNPILNQITGGNRDPKVVRYESKDRWIMTLYVEVDKVHTVHFLTSRNLRDWTVSSTINGFYECPDFFELPLDGNPDQMKWVLTAASSEYMVGSFDGQRFHPETEKLTGHRGKGFYAAQTFSDIPESDGRRIQMGWFQTETKGMPFNQSMSMPLELKLVSTRQGPRLSWSPVREMQTLYGKSTAVDIKLLKPGDLNPLASGKAELGLLEVEFEPGQAAEVAFQVRGAQVVYNVQRQEVLVNGHSASAPMRDGRQTLSIYVDRTGLEIFASHGLSYIPMPFQPKAEDQSFAMEARGGHVKIESLTLKSLESAWKP